MGEKREEEAQNETSKPVKQEQLSKNTDVVGSKEW